MSKNMNKNLIQEIKGINADLIQGKKDNDSKKDMIESMTNENKFIDINDKSTYNNYNLLTADKKNARDKLLNSFLETDRQSNISIEFQLNRERIQSFASSYGGRMVKLINNARSDGFIFYITKFGDAIKKNGGMTNLSKTCNSTPIEINYEYLENYQYNKYRGNYLISTSGGSASSSTGRTVIKVLDHTMSEFHPCGMEDSFVYVGLNKNRNYTHGLKITNSNELDKNGRRLEGCYNDSVNHGPRTIFEDITYRDCLNGAAQRNAIFASAKVGKYSKSLMTSIGINNGIEYVAWKNVDLKTATGQCIMFSNKINEGYKYHKWRPKLEYLGCWGDWEDDTWGFRKKTRAMTWVRRGQNLSFNTCKSECKSRGYNIWGLQYAVGPGKSGQCMCAHESQKNYTWGKYGGANNCTWDKNTGVYVGGGWSNAIYRSTTNPRPQDSCEKGFPKGNVIAVGTPVKFKEDNLGKNAYIDRESISHDLSVTNRDRIFYLNDAKNKNRASNGCSANSEKHYEISSKEWESLRINTGKPRTCNEKQTAHDYNPLIQATNALGKTTGIVQKQSKNINSKQTITQKNIISSSHEISRKSEEAQTILNALKKPITSGFTNSKNNNLNTITNMVNNIMKKITGKKSVIEGHTNACHATETDGICGISITGSSSGHKNTNHETPDYLDAFKREIETTKILETIKKYFVSTHTFEAQKEFTHLDVTSKKQWMYFWGLLVISTLSLKFYIMTKK